jgi:PAS domain S-box-containing protein
VTSPNNASGSTESGIFKALLESSLDIVTLIDQQGNIVYQSSAVEDLTGYTPEEMYGEPVVDYIHADDLDRVLPLLTETLSTPGFSSRLTLQFKHKQKGWVHIDVLGRHFDEAGIKGGIFNSRDITERLEILAELESSNDVLLKTFNSVPILLSISDLKTGRFTHLNPVWLETIGYKHEEAIGHTSGELGIWADPNRRDQLVADLLKQGFLRNEEVTLLTRTGKPLQTIANAELLEIKGRHHILFSVRDVTENVKVENQLRQSQKMEALGQLTGGVAHDFNNLLNVVQSGTELLADFSAREPLAAEIVASVQRAIDRGAALTQQLLAFSRRQHLIPRVIDIKDHLGTMLPLLQTTVGSNIRLHLQASEDLWPCQVDPAHLETAIINLALNARDAMPEGGSLEIQLSNSIIHTVAGLPIRGEYLELKITDSGSGMSQELTSQAFEPFFTTKDVGKGTGLGLSMVFGFIRQSGGHIELDSTEGTGTTVTMYLPKAKLAGKPTMPPRLAAMPSGAGEHILLLEDDADLRRLTSRVLSNLGYKVFEAASEQEVQDQLARVSQIDLMLSDVLLPGRLKGPQIARQVTAQHPNIKVLFMSGYVEGSAEIDLEGMSDGHFLAKPFGQKALAEALRRLLD